jgi:hypothetical protein
MIAELAYLKKNNNNMYEMNFIALFFFNVINVLHCTNVQTITTSLSLR